MGDDQAFIFVNTAVMDQLADVPKSLVRLKLSYNIETDNGLPAAEEFEPVKVIEDELAELAQASGDWYVGRVTVAGKRVFYIYTNTEKIIWESWVSKKVEETEYKIEMTFSVDAQHTGYREDLYPTPDDWQVIKDIGVIENLQSHGDDGHMPRRVDHWVYFKTKADAADFIIWAENDRYTEEPDKSGDIEGRGYCVRLYHEGTCRLPDITSHTIALNRKAMECGGEYDGWEVPVVKVPSLD